MTTTISSNGRVLIPQPVRERHRLRAGDEMLLFELSNGDLVLRRIRKVKKSVVWYLRQLKGLRLERRFEPIREVEV